MRGEKRVRETETSSSKPVPERRGQGGRVRERDWERRTVGECPHKHPSQHFLITVRKWEHRKCPSADEWVHSHPGKSALNRSEAPTRTAPGMDPELTTPREGSRQRSPDGA